jgi:hypothetical protein
LLLGLAACALSGEGTVGDLFTVATYTPTGEGGFMARLDGTLVEQGGCLTVQANGGLVVPVFASGDVVVESGDQLRFGGEEYRLGESITLAGGFSPGQSLPESCAWVDASEVFVVAQV